jgi:hypothetical protein
MTVFTSAKCDRIELDLHIKVAVRAILEFFLLFSGLWLSLLAHAELVACCEVLSGLDSQTVQ